MRLRCNIYRNEYLVPSIPSATFPLKQTELQSLHFVFDFFAGAQVMTAGVTNVRVRKGCIGLEQTHLAG